MATSQKPPISKDQVLKSFQQISAQQKAQEHRILTKEEAAERAKDREVVDVASKYTVEAIVKGLAELQLSFSANVDTLTRRLLDESQRLEQLRRAIEVETVHVKDLSEVKIAADALEILRQEQKDQLRVFEESAKQRRETLDAEIARTRTAWAEESKRHEENAKRYEEQVQRARKKAEEEFTYELARKRKLESDAFEDSKTKLHRNLSAEEAQRNKNWTDRETVLAKSAAELDAFKAKVDGFPAELDEAVKKAREEAIKEGFADAKVRADLLEKEVEANRKVYSLQISSLEEQLAKQTAQVEALTEKLQAALQQSQVMALKAIEGTAHAHAAQKSATA